MRQRFSGKCVLSPIDFARTRSGGLRTAMVLEERALRFLRLLPISTSVESIRLDRANERGLASISVLQGNNLKNIMRLLAIATVFLAASPFVRAQDAASTPFQHRNPPPTEESATPAPAPKSRATPTPETAETFTLQPMASPTLEAIPTPTLEPIASPLPKPTATIATTTPKPMASPIPRPTAIATPRPTATPRPKPTPTPRPTPTPTPQPTPITAESPAADQDQSEVASKLKALEQTWEGSFITHDMTIIEKLVAEDFVGTSSSGKLGNKTTMISEARKDKNVYASAVSGDMIVHSFGPSVAVVTGVARESGKTPAGKAFSHAYRFTDTWVERNGEWQCVAASAMALPKK
jgi:uncharacterized protein DUF4440